MQKNRKLVGIGLSFIELNTYKRRSMVVMKTVIVELLDFDATPVLIQVLFYSSLIGGDRHYIWLG